MKDSRTWRLVFTCFVIASSQWIVSTTAYAQAWVPLKHTGTLKVAYENFFVHDHTTRTGKRFDAGQITQNVMYVEADYGLSKRVAVNLAFPLVAAKYIGTFPHKDPDQVNYIDDGAYHGGVQDFRFGVRYNLTRDRPLVLTPFIEGIVPSRNYPVFGHAMIGRDLHELLVGVNVGRDLGPLLPKAYFQTRMSFAFVERVLDISHNRTNIDTEIAYPVTERMSVTGVAAFQKNHGGLEWLEDFNLYSDEEWHNHGQVFRNDALDIGAGLSFLTTPTTSVFVTVLHSPWSRNAHNLTRGVIAGINWRFDTRQKHPSLP